ncbi:MAG: DUF2088 domain-containing protein, partial [Oscillospiraceae bacterium]|nr:DUF2088 domain-containing protein [Oscillospiraceae bacterium]
MKEFTLYPAEGREALSQEEVRAAVENAVAEYKGSGKRILLIVPDYTRYHSNAGLIANTIYHALPDCQVELLEALGTHLPMTEEQLREMFGDSIPMDAYIAHDFRNGIEVVGTV